MAKTERFPPSELTDSWPDTPSSDPAGEKARQLSLNLRQAIGAHSVRSIAEIAGIDERTLRNVLSGARWPDLRTIVLLEEALDGSLWPARPESSAASTSSDDTESE